MDIEDAIQDIAAAIRDAMREKDFTPTPSKKQFIRDAAVQMAAQEGCCSRPNHAAFAEQLCDVAEAIWDESMRR